MPINPLFNATYYQALHLDLILAGLNSTEQLWQHYMDYGASENRKPNAWFDADYYLQHNPDLVWAGLNAAQAFQHFYEYGLYESVRHNTFSRSIKNQDFTAVDYASAASNSDLLAAFAIHTPDQLSEVQQAQLLGHYLSWGYAEGREGAGPLAQKIKADLVVQQQSRGTVADDEIYWSYAYMNAGSLRFIDGLGGFDTLVLGPRIVTGIGAEALNLTSIERLVIDAGTQLVTLQSGAQFEATTLVQQMVLAAADSAVGTDLKVQLHLAPSVIEAAHDTLQLTVLNTGQHQGVSLLTNGYETVQVQLGEQVQRLAALEVNQTQGATFTVQLQGGSSAGLHIGALQNKGSPLVQQLVIDATALKGPLQVGQWGQLNQVLQIKVLGPQAWQAGVEALGLTLGLQHNVHWVGAATADVLLASAAIDTLQGGAGADVFDFSVAELAQVRVQPKGDAFQIAALDTILDFKKGDGLRLDTLEWIAPRTGQNASLRSLEEAVAQVQKAGQAFNFQNDGYVVLQMPLAADGSDLKLIKLSGVDMSRFFDDQGQAQWDTALQAFTWVS